LQKRLHVNITDRIDSSGNREAAAGRPPTIATGEFGVPPTIATGEFGV